MKKSISGLLVCLAIASVGTSAFASENQGLSRNSGGWTEGIGYYTNSNNTSLQSKSLAALSSTSPESHTATKSYTGSSVLLTRLTAETYWSGEYHYTRARFEYLVGSSVIGDTDRVWGNDHTIAQTSYVDATGTTAKSYWGN